MDSDRRNVLAAPVDLHEAVETSMIIDADELEEARLDERWREFCLNAERYVAETTRPSARGLARFFPDSPEAGGSICRDQG